MTTKTPKHSPSSLRRRVLRTSPKNGRSKEFESAAAAARASGLDPVTVAHAAGGKHNTGEYGGFRWSYLDPPRQKGGTPVGFKHSEETKRKMSLAKEAKKRPVEAYQLDGTFVARYNSLSDARKAMGDDSCGNILDSALGRRGRGTHKGLVWKLVPKVVVPTKLSERRA